MDILAKSRIGRHRRIFENIFDQVCSFWENEIDQHTPLADETVKRMFLSYKERVKAKRSRLHNNRSEFFRNYSFIALNIRDKTGKRHLKSELLDLYMNDRSLRTRVDREVRDLTLRLIDGMHFANNIPQI